MMGTIYTIVNRTTQKVYVGQTWESLTIRWGRHKYKALHGDTSCRHLYAAIRKYGVDDFDVQVKVQADDQEKLDYLEKYWIEALLAANREFGYNLKSGGSAGRHSLETRQKMSRTRTGRPNPHRFQTGRVSVRTLGRVPWNKGRSRDPETKLKISISKTGVPWSEARREVGNPKHTPETKIQMCESQKVAQRLRRSKETECQNGHSITSETHVWRARGRVCLVCERARGQRAYWKNKQASSE